MTPKTAAAIAPADRRPARVSFSFANGCAWRAVYVRINDRQVFSIGVDPVVTDRAPTLFGAVLGRSFRVRLPHLRWKYQANPVRAFAARMSSRFWVSLDGRYGALRPGVFNRLREHLADVERRHPLAYAATLILACDAVIVVVTFAAMGAA